MTRLLAHPWVTGDPELSELARLRIAQLLGNDAELRRHPTAAPWISSDRIAELRRWPTSTRFSEVEQACLAFTEQFVIDVSGVTEELRASVGTCLGPTRVGGFVITLFILDYGQRAQMAIERLFPDAHRGAGEPDRSGDTPAGDGALMNDLDELMKAIARLNEVDMVTTELVRLRGARQHNCRLCKSTRSAKALDAGADEAMFDKTEWYEDSDLAASHKVALRLADAIITQPNEIDAELVAQAHEHFTPAQVIEIVVDVMRNSGQKVAVALAVDAPHVRSGVELYEITEEGDVEFLG
jgi:alkylhydroperoxidase family enzyme